MILDAGPEAVRDICAAFDKAATLIWNGPLGAFEVEPFDIATNSAAQHTATLTREGQLTSIAGGGDTVAALNHAGREKICLMSPPPVGHFGMAGSETYRAFRPLASLNGRESDEQENS